MARFASQSLIISALFLGVAQAENNSTSGNTTMVGWVSPAPRRSTWSIIWTCLSIFIVCSWKCVHLNIPTHEEIQGEWHTFQLCRGLPDVSFWPKAPLRRKWGREIIWMTVIALAPEFGVALAAMQYRDARLDLKEFRRHLSSEDISAQKCTMAHAFYVQMGGIVICKPSTRAEWKAQVKNDPEQTFSPTRHGNFMAKVSRSLYIEPGMLRIPEHEVKDLSKADVITKAFAIIQCTWLVVQSICRAAQGHTISLLELATLEFIFCAFIMHIFWWNKPFDVESRRVIIAMPPNLENTAVLNTLSMDDLTASNEKLFRKRIQDLSPDIVSDLVFEIVIMHEDRKFSRFMPSISLYIASTTFLAIHLAAWNWEFPSTVVSSLWRWLNLGTLVVSFMPLLAAIASYWTSGEYTRFSDYLFMSLAAASAVFYIISRLVVLGLTFYCLLLMPESAYTTLDWLAWVPHFS
ncbi:hypothetical protein FCIRC_2505 [Fusarium circinatum]|uniref:Uncharacterized protein n=1 Tax=Fusarium circinatum TaxID=48490 RepID=A0A8H5UFQ0_FUSCI|nr:hypothetical protein FCIRC_2505 [Fusarium circinatum]